MAYDLMFDGWYNLAARPSKQHRGPVPTAQVDWELKQLLRIYYDLHPRTVVEIGSQYGGTLYHFMENSTDNAKIISICKGPEKWNPPIDFDTDVWFKWAEEFGVEFHRIVGDSHEEQTAAQVASMVYEVDFLFIDGDHSYEGALADFLTYGPLVRIGGIIALHDLKTPAQSPHIQIERLWREIQAAGYKTQELRVPDSWFGGIGVIYK